ncbi:MAG TPA: hypothetical protein ENH12_05220, partial [Proteobacteria bacterium]|nr:hypothetical protein [Pseudomonadota bacterium]
RKITIRLGCTIILSSIIAIPVYSSVANKRPSANIKNVIFIILDALRADHLGIYGYHRNTSPNIDKIAGKGLVFDRAIVQSGWTKSSIPTYFTSTYPSIHGVIETDDSFPKNFATMAEIFKYNGYFTIGLVDNVHISPLFNFNRGFDIYEELKDDEIIEGLRSILLNHYSAGLLDLDDLDEPKKNSLIQALKRSEKYNLVKNPGFEEGNTGWKSPRNCISSSQSRTGTKSAHINKKVFPSNNFWHLNQSIKLKHGCDYIIGAFIKTRGLSKDVTMGMREGKNKIYQYSQIGHLSGDNDWTLLAGIYTPYVCDDNYESEVIIRPGRMLDFIGGECWVDDVFVIPLSRVIEQGLPSPADKFFFYVHLLDPHAPYTPSGHYLRFGQRQGEVDMIDRYDGEIRSLDDRLGLIFDEMEAAGLLDESLIIITADHGEAFGEHGFKRHHANFCYEETVHVPMIICNPELVTSPRRVMGPVPAAVGLLPSLVDILNLKLPPGVKFQGKSFFRDKPEPSEPVFFYQGPYLKMVTDDRWKYIGDEYGISLGDVEIIGKSVAGGGAQMTVNPPGRSGTEYIADEEELFSSNLYRQHSRKIQDKIKQVFRAADRNLHNFGDRKEALLFDLKNDPGEMVNVADKYPRKVEYFQNLMREQRAADRGFKGRAGLISGGKVKITNDIKKKLRA